MPDDWRVTVVRKKPMPLVPSEEQAVNDALAHPVGCAGLRDLVRGKTSACILICDITRPTPNGLILPTLLSELEKAGLSRENIRVLVATGLHRPNEGEELRQVVGDDAVLGSVRVENHFAREDADHVDLGVTSLGTRVRLDKRFVTADLKIAVGLVEPHFMAGYSGGRKLIMPGVAHSDTITYLHNARFMSDPGARNCNLIGNPLHDQQLEIVGMLGGALGVNVVIDEQRRLSYVNFGEIVQSHLRAVEFIRPYVEIELPRTFQTVLTSGGGYPLDKTYYQTVKGMVAAMEILASGGNLFIVSEIAEGLGSPEYAAAQEQLVTLGPQGFYESIQGRPYAAIDAWQTQKQLEPMQKGHIHLFTRGLSDRDIQLTGVRVIDDLPLELERRLGADKQIAVIPEGPYVLPRVTG